MDEQPKAPSTTALLVHLIGRLDAIEAEQRAHRQAFEEHRISTRRHRWFSVAASALEWRATAVAGATLMAANWPMVKEKLLLVVTFWRR